MQDEKNGVDSMMQNIIEQGLKNGDQSKCHFKELVDEQTGKPKEGAKDKIDEYMEKGCAYILNDQQSAF